MASDNEEYDDRDGFERFDLRAEPDSEVGPAEGFDWSVPAADLAYLRRPLAS